jgi:hypothetical protein
MTASVFDIPVYRCSEHRFELRFAKDLFEHLASFEARSGGIARSQAPTAYAAAEQHFRESYGGPWRFTQIIAWLCLCPASSSICADLWVSDAKRFRRAPRQRRFQFVGTERWSESNPAIRLGRSSPHFSNVLANTRRNGSRVALCSIASPSPGSGRLSIGAEH